MTNQQGLRQSEAVKNHSWRRIHLITSQNALKSDFNACNHELLINIITVRNGGVSLENYVTWAADFVGAGQSHHMPR